jgi:hypothetical protein
MKFSGKPLFDPATDPFANYRLLGGAMALVILYFSTTQIWLNWARPVCHDFIAFWGAAKLAIAGSPALAYDPAILHKLQTAVAEFGPGQSMPFGYMPGFLLLVLPFGLLSYPAAMTVWVCLTLIAYLVALKRLVPRAGLLALAFPPVLVDCIVGQNGFLTAALFFGGVALLERRPFVAGLLIGCLVIKPQLALLFPLALLVSRQWRAIAGAAASSIGVALAGLIAFGPATMAAWLGSLPLFASIAKNGTVGWMQLASVYAAARQAGVAAGPAFALHMAVLAAAALLVWRVWRISNDMLARASTLACATALSSTYLFLYDQLILVIAFFWLAGKKVRPAILVSLWCIPIVSIAQHAGKTGPINLNPVLPICLLALIARELWKDRSKPACAVNAQTALA